MTRSRQGPRHRAHITLIEGTNERKLYLDATHRLHTIYQKPVRYRSNWNGTGPPSASSSVDPLKNEPDLPAFLGNDDGAELEPRWDWLPLGMDDDAEVFAVNMHQNHMLVIGQIGSGKSTSVNTLACGALTARYVTPWWQDPQNLSFKPFRNAGPYAGDPDTCLALMGEFHTAMQKREIEMGELDCSLATPTAKWPLQIMFIDELKRLIDPRLRGDEFVKTYLGLLFDVLDTGRKVGFSVVATSTDPRASLFKEGLRNQFTMSMCFKVRDVTAARVVLGTIEKGYEPHLLPKVPGRCVFMGSEWHQLRTFRVWDGQVRKVVDSLATQDPATRASAGVTPASPQDPLTNGGISVSADDLSSRRRHRRRDDTRGRIVDYLQQHPARLVSEIAEALDIAESVVRYHFGSDSLEPDRGPPARLPIRARAMMATSCVPALTRSVPGIGSEQAPGALHRVGGAR